MEPGATNRSDHNLKSPFVIHPRGTFQHSATNLDTELDIMPSQQRILGDIPEHVKTLKQCEESAKLEKLHFMGEND